MKKEYIEHAPHGELVSGGGLWRFVEVCGLCFREARPVVQFVFLLRILAGASFAGPLLAANAGSLLAVAAFWICATWAVYLYNGVSDVEEDRTNGSGRPIASGELNVSDATNVAVGLGAFALVGTSLWKPDLTWSVALVLVMGWLYSAPPLSLKRRPAGLVAMGTIAALLTYYAGYAAAGDGDKELSLFVFATLMALWMVLVGQTKDLSDVEGDARGGRRSLPIVWGEAKARLAISGSAVAIGSAFIIANFILTGGLLVPAGVVLLGAVTVAATSLGPWSRGGSRAVRRRPYRAFMATQYLANIAMIAI